MTKLAITLAALVILGSTVGAPAAVAATPLHASIVTHATVSKAHASWHDSAQTAHARLPHDQNPFADLLLG
jgi:hypothetical protein